MTPPYPAVSRLWGAAGIHPIREETVMSHPEPRPPQRIQRERTPGWRLAAATSNPLGAKIVSRPSRWGNPCRVSTMQEMGYEDPHAAAAANFVSWLRGNRFDAPTDEADRRRERILRDLPTLRGRDLACTCRPEQVCHADELLRLANLPVGEQQAWIAGVRERVDRGRFRDGLPAIHPQAAGAVAL